MAESAAENATASDWSPVERADQLLDSIARSLRAQFGERIDDSVIVAAVKAALGFHEGARVTQFVPIFVERRARDRLGRIHLR